VQLVSGVPARGGRGSCCRAKVVQRGGERRDGVGLGGALSLKGCFDIKPYKLAPPVVCDARR
jgi:hypothetical protein